MSKRKCALLLAVAAGCLSIGAEASFAGLAKLSGGSGYSGNLSKNKTIRQQELICDPATTGPTGPAGGTGDPISGSTSTTYDPSLVSLSGLVFGPGYTGQGYVEEETPGEDGEYIFLQDISSFLTAPEGTQTGYVQVSYSLTGTPGTMSPESGFATEATNGVSGVDTHALLFTYNSSASDSTAATYTIYADPGDRSSGNNADSLTGISSSGEQFTLGPSQLSSATVSGSLAVPLPPAAWTGSAMLLALLSTAAVRKTRLRKMLNEE